MSDLADCYAATVARPDGQGPRDRLVSDCEPSHRSANSAETADHSLVIDDFELVNSTQDRLGPINGHRWVQTVKRECLSKLILLGEQHLRRALSEFVAHYHEQRPHQGIGDRLIVPSNDEPPDGDKVVVDERLGGLLRSYRRSA